MVFWLIGLELVHTCNGKDFKNLLPSQLIYLLCSNLCKICFEFWPAVQKMSF